ncbi:hypothetical protein [Massilia sp. Dwa41.01b]|uniref:hypothetical protein n=1 Tax=Massilia sp. Dwa41.01b TaxID=2709302 RepID=UPI001E371C51|nr:hypothetical protein [Massilia sp. Dwa41.01b]
MDGYELARRLRADPATGGALFIALTGYGQAHDRILSKSSGFEHHFVKPMDTDRLAQVLAGCAGVRAPDDGASRRQSPCWTGLRARANGRTAQGRVG